MKNPKLENNIQRDLLSSVNDKLEFDPTFEACLQVHGMYETMRFVLRLSPRNHDLMEVIESNNFDASSVTQEVIQAYSTYIHETIHWWQHVGSTSGLLFSLSYLAQAHSSLDELKDVLAKFGPKKPLKGWTDQILLAEGNSAQAKLAYANVAVNNALDVEYYKQFAYDPRKNANSLREQPHFEAVGYGYFIVYGQLIGLISSIIDPDLAALPKIQNWDNEVQRLRAEECEGFYHGSPLRLPAVGLRAVYEGQARFVQLQFLNGALQEELSVKKWRDEGYLAGIYVEAFESFLELTESDWPEIITDPIVGLFLLVCDLSINPTRGIPFDIESFEDLILDVDVGTRFTRLCLAVKELPHLRVSIKDYSKSEYVNVANQLSEATGYDPPLAALQRIVEWLKTAPGLGALMEEHRTFEFDQANLPLRVFVSHFVAFSKDKLEYPEFFCWPGMHMTGASNNASVTQIWLRHLSLFSDRGDKTGVYPRKWPNRSEEAVMKTFQRFYGTMTLYDLTRQWILFDGPFECDYRWLMENYSQERVDEWADDTFRQVFGVSLKDFEIVQ